MYQNAQGSGHLVAVFFAAGVVLLSLGWWTFRRFRDPQGYQHFGVGPRGLLAYGGIVLMVLGGASCLVGVFLPAILR